VECHEIWRYDDGRHVQTLAGLAALCPACHAVKHIGLAELNGRGEAAKSHRRKVNGWTEEDVDAYLEGVWEVWFGRSRHEWKLDLAWLERRGVNVAPKR
jgi:hypothetical protein